MTTSETAEPESSQQQLLRLLSPREAQALAHLVAGLDTRAIAEALGIAPSTARTHLHRAMRKLGVRTRAEAAALAAPTPTDPTPAEPLPADPALEDPTPADPAPEPTRAGFEALYARCHDDLVQQTYLLTAGRHSAAHAVRLAFGSAWNRWPAVCAEPDPEAWIRARAFDAALSPWHRVGPLRTRARQLPRRRIKVAEEPASAPADGLTDRDRALLKALLRLSRPRRRDLVLHDALGLPPAAVAAEVHTSAAGVEDRVRAARAALAAAVPRLVGADPAADGFGQRLGGLLYAAAVRGCPPPRQPSPAVVRTAGRLRAAAAPTAFGLLVLATGAALGGLLAGHGPSTFFAARPQPLPVCTTAETGSAGPAAPGHLDAAGLRSAWCGPVPGQPAVLVAGPALPADQPSPTAAATAASAATPAAGASPSPADSDSPGVTQDQSPADAPIQQPSTATIPDAAGRPRQPLLLTAVRPPHAAGPSDCPLGVPRPCPGSARTAPSPAWPPR
ncbi:DNA-directed RNA polymerase specialized sigma24 family protein [Kitasatospora sp. MAP12-44]|nr:helix-turn-helix transcriptional regulator [Kitasatospora sp. MAP12-44]MDH6110915.1 DNA-directed RNA polymerase specialized sigma24 family protein [Kitasatospora sp. MAP12-44]